MLKEHTQIINQTHKLADLVLTAAAFILSYFIKRDHLGGLTTVPNYYILLLAVIIIWFITLDLCGLYSSQRGRSFAGILFVTVKGVSAAMIALLICMYLFRITEISRIMLGIFYLLNIVFLGVSKGTIYSLLNRYRRKGYNYRNILVLGSRERAQEIIRHIRDYPTSGFRIMGCLETSNEDVGKEVCKGVYVIGTLDNLESVLLNQVVDELVIAMPLRLIEGVTKYISLAEELGISIRLIPDWQIHRMGYSPSIASTHFEDFLGFPTMAFITTPANRAQLLVKAALDYLVACVVCLVSLPLFAALAAAIKVSSRGPVFFVQERCGLNGRRFMIYKFRTMVADAEAKRKQLEHLNETDGPVFKIRKDPRIIPYIGKFLRKTSLDEMPQFINVLKGEMSIVGPRPPIPAEVSQYDAWQRRRLSMKPGLTCLWQTASNRNDLSFEEWMNLDLDYIDHWSLGLDFRILLKTAMAVFFAEGR